MRYLLLTVLITTAAMNSRAQDERDFSKMIIGDAEEGEGAKGQYLFKASSPLYRTSLTDNHKEALLFIKKDSEDWLYIKDHNGWPVFKHVFKPKGLESRFIKLKIRRLSKDSKVIIIYYYEGHTGHLSFKATGRLYFLTIDDNDLKTLKMYKGPYFWDESRNHRGYYYRRLQKVDIHDFDRDGIKDISVYHNNLRRIYLYRKGGKWITRDR